MFFKLDSWLFFLINRNSANPVFDFLMPYVTFLGSGQFIFLIGAALMLASYLAGNKRQPPIVLFAGMTVSYTVMSVLKNFFARPRPFMTLHGVRVFGIAKDFSFPSGHAIFAFTAAAVLASYFRGRIVFYTLAALVAFSRVYLGAHYVSDVLAGAALGILLGKFIAVYSKKA